jgi:protease YdgD
VIVSKLVRLLCAGVLSLGFVAGAQAQPKLPDAPVAKLPDAPKPTLKYPGNDLKGISANDTRKPADTSQMPWRAVGRLKAGGASCTGAIVGPALVLTAAHCVFNNQSRQFFAPGDLHFLLGYSEGKFAAEAVGTAVIKPDDYDGVLAIGSMGKDWALIKLDHEIGTPDIILPLREISPMGGTPVSLGGYAKDHIETLMADQECAITGLMSDRSGMPMLRHNCNATHGVSGAPLLVHDPGGWAIAGIEVVGSDNGGGATVLYDVREAMQKLKK